MRSLSITVSLAGKDKSVNKNILSHLTVSPRDPRWIDHEMSIGKSTFPGRDDLRPERDILLEHVHLHKVCS